ncbi:MAG: uroporphyrinogen decarboxylase family protein [bacterium]|nr:uroporphyrinogen decarboxylase family protein [bacterium]
MNRRERLMATLQGEAVDRPAVSFYELNGLDEDPNDPDPFNIYSDPSWRPLLNLAREKTDRIVMRGVAFKDVLPDPLDELAEVVTLEQNGCRITERTVRAGGRKLTSRTRRAPDVNTVWTEEHLLKNLDDLKAFLEIPARDFVGKLDISSVLDAEAALSDSGVVMIDTPDPLCLAASLFDMGEYTVIAMTESRLFHQLLDRFAVVLHRKTKLVSRGLPGRLWRIYGPEYASPPYLSPQLFREYVVKYDQPMIDSIHRHGGYARMHSHGKLRAILDDIVSMGADGLDPIEPPPQGDVELHYVRQRYGKELVLFGNIEVSDIETLPTDQFAEKVKRALGEGTQGNGRGFVLMPSACPCGRKLSARALHNYEVMVEMAEKL